MLLRREFHPYFPDVDATQLKETGDICSSNLPVLAVFGDPDWMWTLDSKKISNPSPKMGDPLKAADKIRRRIVTPIQTAWPQKKSLKGLSLITWNIDVKKPNIFCGFFQDEKKNNERLANVKAVLERFKKELKPDLILLQGADSLSLAFPEYLQETKEHGCVFSPYTGLVVFYNLKKYHCPQYKTDESLDRPILNVTLSEKTSQGPLTFIVRNFHSLTDDSEEEACAVLTESASPQTWVIGAGDFGFPIMAPGRRNLMTGFASVPNYLPSYLDAKGDGDRECRWATHGVLYCNGKEKIYQPKTTVLRPYKTGALTDGDEDRPITTGICVKRPKNTILAEARHGFNFQTPEIRGVMGPETQKKILISWYINFLNKGFFNLSVRQGPRQGNGRGSTGASDSSHPDLGQLLYLTCMDHIDVRECLPEALLSDFSGLIDHDQHLQQNPAIIAVRDEAKRLLQAFNKDHAHERATIARTLACVIFYVRDPGDPSYQRLKKEANHTLGAGSALAKWAGLIQALLSAGLICVYAVGVVTGLPGNVALGAAALFAVGSAFAFFRSARRTSLAKELDGALSAPKPPKGG